MTDTHREHRPLLCDEYSDEEFDVKNYNYQRRNRILIRSGRVRNYAKGAAAVLTRWPDHCSTSVVYWWLGVSMIAITIFVIYNSVLIFGMLPTSDLKPPKYRTFNNDIKPKAKMLPGSDVYMHLIVNNSTDVIINNYLTYATVVSKKYPSFKYKFLVVINDTATEDQDYKDEERNEIAFNSLWTKKKRSKKVSNEFDISVEHIFLSAYLNDSPIKKFWRHLPSHFIEFLVRSISIWEKGGIAFNPKILIPDLYSPHYLEKLYDILNIYDNMSSNYAYRKINSKLHAGINTKRPNNIQDILNDLERGNNNISNIDLSEAENNDVVVSSNTDNILTFKRDAKYNSGIDYNGKNESKENNKVFDNDTQLNEKKDITSKSTNKTHDIDNILPLFLKYLFDNKSKLVDNIPDVLHLDMSRNNTSIFDSLNNFNQNQSLPVEKLKPSIEHDAHTITTAKTSDLQIPVDNFPPLKINKYHNAPEISIDVKGNIIASKTACHAFLGTMFSNVIQHTEKESLTDFIISELSLFCNGLLTSCPGVNLILV